MAASKPKRRFPYTVCRYCGSTVRLKAAGGDWLNDLYPVRHDAPNTPGTRCEGSYRAVENADIKQER